MYPFFSFYIYFIFISSPQPLFCFFNYRYLQLQSPYPLFVSQPLPFFPHSLPSPSLSTLPFPPFHPPSSVPLILYFPFSLQFLNNAYCLTPILQPLSSILTSRCHNFSPHSFKRTLFPFQLIHSPSLLSLQYSINLYLNVDPFLHFTPHSSLNSYHLFVLPFSLPLNPATVFSKLYPKLTPFLALKLC
jgi:hypothetical protein